jgi:hypothetical protein
MGHRDTLAVIAGELGKSPPLCSRATVFPTRLGKASVRQITKDKVSKTVATRAMIHQGTLFGRGTPPRQTTVTVDLEAITAVAAGRIDGERMIAAAVRAARPDVRNVAVDVGTIRWTDPKSRRRVTFDTPAVVRAALLRIAGGAAPEPFRFILGRAARVMRGD